MALTIATGFPESSFKEGFTRLVYRINVANSDTATLNHATLVDPDKLRKVYITRESDGFTVVPETPANVVTSIARTDEDTTTIVFGSAGAGDYVVTIEL